MSWLTFSMVKINHSIILEMIYLLPPPATVSARPRQAKEQSPVYKLFTGSAVRPVTELVVRHSSPTIEAPPNLSKLTNRPILRNAGEQYPSERVVGGGVLPPILPEGIAGGTHPSTAQQNTDSSPAFHKRDKNLGFYSTKGLRMITIVALKSRKMNALSLVLVSIFRPGQGVF